MRYLVCFNFLPKRRISCPKGPRSHGFCGLTEAQAALNYVARSCLKSEGRQSFIPLAPNSWLRHTAEAMWLVQFQERPFGMCDTLEYAKTFIFTPAHSGLTA